MIEGQIPRKPADILSDAAALLVKKGADYQNESSIIRQADYFVHGVDTIVDIMHVKLLRIRSVLDAMKNDPNYKQNFESLQDSGIDIINYASFFCSYLEGGIDGQSPERDFLNRNKI